MPEAVRLRSHGKTIFTGEPRRQSRWSRNCLLGKKVRPVLAGATLGFAPTPGGDFGVVSGEENIWNFPAAELGRPGVLRRCEPAGGEAFIDRRLLVTQDPGKEPDDCVNENNCGNCAI